MKTFRYRIKRAHIFRQLQTKTFAGRVTLTERIRKVQGHTFKDFRVDPYPLLYQTAKHLVPLLGSLLSTLKLETEKIFQIFFRMRILVQYSAL